MKLEIILLIIISIGFGISLVYFIGYNKISIIKAKMDAANDIISKALKDKKDIMNEINELFNKIDSINEILIANKKYYNKNNNLLMKTIKGYIKVIAKINNIKVQTSYETK